MEVQKTGKRSVIPINWIELIALVLTIVGACVIWFTTDIFGLYTFCAILAWTYVFATKAAADKAKKRFESIIIALLILLVVFGGALLAGFISKQVGRTDELRAYMSAARAYMSDAQADWELLEALREEKAERLTMEAVHLLNTDDYKGAETYFEGAILSKPDYAKAFYGYAHLLAISNRKSEEVLNKLEKAIQLNAEYKKEAREDETFKQLRQDERFKKLIEE